MPVKVYRIQAWVFYFCQKNIMKTSIVKVVLIISCLLSGNFLLAQMTERERPKEWDQLVYGARFMDRFLPMSTGKLSSDTWGIDSVKPRFVDNGIEDRTWSYWGGNIMRGEDNLYHLFVCGWLENSPKGHHEWSQSLVFNAVSDNPTGPFVTKDFVGKGHNPEAFRLKDGRYVIYVIDGRFVSDNINGPWVYGKFDFEPRDRNIIEGLSNLTFAQREDGSYLMVCRGGGVWISETGLSSYNQITDKRVYPDVEGRFEDPVVWKDHIQYHLIVNDWYGRIAYYLRSKDGINWVVDPGEAYMPGIARHEDGSQERWFKYERMKVFQDAYGRAIQANFAVIDVLKNEDKSNDEHSSKNISIPLDPGLLLTILNDKPVTPKTKAIRVKIQAEEGFDPHTDIDLESLRFGASAEVNFGRGGKALKTEKAGNDLIVTFDGLKSAITAEEFAPKLIGKRKDGNLLYGYARLPSVDFIEPILSARAPVFIQTEDGVKLDVEVQNFGQVASGQTTLNVEYVKDGKNEIIAAGALPALEPYDKTVLSLDGKTRLEKEKEYEFLLTILSGDKVVSTFRLKKKLFL